MQGVVVIFLIVFAVSIPVSLIVARPMIGRLRGLRPAAPDVVRERPAGGVGLPYGGEAIPLQTERPASAGVVRADRPSANAAAADTGPADTAPAGAAAAHAAEVPADTPDLADATRDDTAAAPAEKAPADTAAADTAPAEAPADEAPADTAPADTASADKAPADTPPAIADAAREDRAAVPADTAPTAAGAVAADAGPADTPAAAAPAAAGSAQGSRRTGRGGAAIRPARNALATDPVVAAPGGDDRDGLAEARPALSPAGRTAGPAGRVNGATARIVEADQSTATRSWFSPRVATDPVAAGLGGHADANGSGRLAGIPQPAAPPRHAPSAGNGGLPKRVPGASLAPGLRHDAPAGRGTPSAVIAAPRSPEDVKAVMTSLQAGFDPARQGNDGGSPDPT